MRVVFFLRKSRSAACRTLLEPCCTPRVESINANRIAWR
jgi:hypothetical protein